MKIVFFTILFLSFFGTVFFVVAQDKEKSCLAADNIQNNISCLKEAPHNCRFWGMLTAGSFNDSTKISHLDSLQQLASSNANGWGFGFYTKTIRGGHIPVIYRGMWRADHDCLFDSSAKVMLSNLSTGGIAHIRNASNGYINIPNPHPFITKSTQRDFCMLFAHNGGLNIPLLITLLDSFTNNAHYSYSGNGVNDPNLDSDLYRLYLMKWIDEHPTDSITTCLKNALDTLSNQMGFGLSYNFVMVSTYDTLWALCYNSTLSYRRENGMQGYVWEVASEPLGGTDWVNATNYYLYVFTTGNASPDSIQINSHLLFSNRIDDNLLFNIKFANPSVGKTIEIKIDTKVSQSVLLQLYDTQGHLVLEITEMKVENGQNHFSFDISYVQSGIYFLKMASLNGRLTKKIVILNNQ